jgi:hypothetical protein
MMEGIVRKWPLTKTWKNNPFSLRWRSVVFPDSKHHPAAANTHSLLLTP